MLAGLLQIGNRDCPLPPLMVVGHGARAWGEEESTDKEQKSFLNWSCSDLALCGYVFFDKG